MARYRTHSMAKHPLLISEYHSRILILVMKPSYMPKKSLLRKLLQYFLQGLIILAPIVITIWAVTTMFNFIDRILPNLIEELFPNLKDFYVTGMGFLVVILVVFLVGYVSSNFVVGRLVELFDNILQKTPGIKIIYTTLKDFFEAFAGNKRKFDKAVLVSIDAPDIWRIGFITQEDLHEFGLQEFVAVYVPHSYGFVGQLFFVKKQRVKLLTDISSAEAMKFVISGGVTEIEDEAKAEN